MHPTLARAMDRHGGVFATSDALAAGVDRNAFGPLLRSGSWRRIRYDVYTTGELSRRIQAAGGALRLQCRLAHRLLDRTPIVLSHAAPAPGRELVGPRSGSVEVRLRDP